MAAMINAVQRARQVAALEEIKAGKVKFPLVCKHCGSKSVTEKDLRSEYAKRFEDDDPDIGGQVLYCFSCGRRTGVEEAKRVRQEKMRKFIRDGVDVPIGRRVVSST